MSQLTPPRSAFACPRSVLTRPQLTSFANTPQNAVAIAFVLGAVFSWFGRNALGFFGALSSNAGGSLPAALSSPILGAYLAAWATFHLAEYLVTAIYNPEKAGVDCASILFLSC